MSRSGISADNCTLDKYREYLRLLASQQLAADFRGKVDPSGIVQDTLFEAHRALAGGLEVRPGQRLAWLRKILANNLADEVRRMTADKRDVNREVSLERAVELSSRRLEMWLARDMAPHAAAEHEEQVLRLVAAMAKLPEAQREAVALHYWGGLALAEIAHRLDRSRDAVAGLLKRGLRELRAAMHDAPACDSIWERSSE